MEEFFVSRSSQIIIILYQKVSLPRQTMSNKEEEETKRSEIHSFAVMARDDTNDGFVLSTSSSSIERKQRQRTTTKTSKPSQQD